MKMKRTFALALLVCCAVPAAPVHADTVYCWNCSEKFTQALDRVTNLEQLQALFKRMSGIHLAIPVFSKGYRLKQGKVVP